MAKKKFIRKLKTTKEKIINLIPFIAVSFFIFMVFNGKYHFNKDTSAVFVLCSILYGIFYSYDQRDKLSDNVLANRVISPFVFIGYTAFFLNEFKHGRNTEVIALISGLKAIFVYLYASSYFQPDLDVRSRRPGMTHFPTGQWISKMRLGRFIRWLFIPITKSWHRFWGFYSEFVTHRGVTHYPIIGVYCRVVFMLIFVFPLDYILIDMFNVRVLHGTVNWLLMFFPGSKAFMSIDFVIYCSPIFISDIVHSLVDYVDSVKRGMPFRPGCAPKGLFFSMIHKIINK